MIDGILDINLIPDWNSPDIRTHLIQSLTRSKLLQAAVAYWTINDNIMGCNLARALNHHSGFLSVDLHLPTDIDALAALSAKGANVYLYCEDIPTQGASGHREPPHLVHSKMLLFWSEDRIAELWVGSHNWTNRAIFGLNVESSLVIRLRDSSSLFCDAAGYLEKIRRVCEKFDPSRVDFYKQLQQKSSNTIPVISLEAKNATSLDNSAIGFFGTDTDDLKQLGKIPLDVYIEAFDTDTGSPSAYPATILHSGLLSSSHKAAGGISFSPRRYAFRKGRRFPFLLPENEVGTDVLKDAAYFLTLELRRLDSWVSLDYPTNKGASWEPEADEISPLLKRLGAASKKALFAGKRARPKRPVRIDQDDTRALTLIERRALPEQRLVTRRILRRSGP